MHQRIVWIVKVCRLFCGKQLFSIVWRTASHFELVLLVCVAFILKHLETCISWCHIKGLQLSIKFSSKKCIVVLENTSENEQVCK